MTGDLLAQARAKRGKRSTPPAQIGFDEDLIPDLEPSTYEPSEDDLTIDGILDGVDILEAYRRWCGKMTPNPGDKRESIMCSCPVPGHADANPSAWINLDKNTWYCGGCLEGGDKYDLAAYHFGFATPGYKTDGKFPALRRAMAEDLGFVVTRTAKRTIVTAPAPAEEEDDSTDPPTAPITIAPAPPPAVVRVEWKDIVPPETFMHEWMTVCSLDDLPEEYYFWLGLMACGLAAGDDTVLRDNPRVKGNLFVTLYGETGTGKTRSIRALEELLGKALPYDANDPYSTGISMIAAPGSGEALVDEFSKPMYDPTDPKKIIGYSQVRGLLRIDELADLVGRASRHGSILKPYLMRLYDAYGNLDHRTRGMGLVRAYQPYCAAVTSTQPGAIRDLLIQADADSGFVNRWVFAMGAPKPLVAIDREPLDIDSVVPSLARMRAWAGTKREINLNRDAQDIWQEFFTRVIEPLKLSGEDPLLARTDLTLKKLMLLFALNERSNEVTGDMMDRVLMLWPYLRDSYISLSGQIGIGEFESCRYRVLTFMKENGGGATLRTLSRHMPKQFTRKMIMEAVENLTAMGELSVDPTIKKAGRPSVFYRLSA